MTSDKPNSLSEEAGKWLRIAANVATILSLILATVTAIGWLWTTPLRGSDRTLERACILHFPKSDSIASVPESFVPYATTPVR